MLQYQCILFDLDHTLWDFETNSGAALTELYKKYDLQQYGSPSCDVFLKTFSSVNAGLWEQYDRGLIHRNVLRLERFHRVFLACGIDDHAMSLRFSADYLAESPRGKSLIPGSIEVLDYLVKKYSLYIITNGFDEVQSIKMASSGITPYFKDVFSSEKIGHKKPSPEIFAHAIDAGGFLPEQVIMIGDNLLTDIQGARNAGIHCVYFNPADIPHEETVTWEIRDLRELRNIL